MKLHKISFMLLCSILLFQATVQARAIERNTKQTQRNNLRQKLNELNLNPEQKKQIAGIIKKYRPEIKNKSQKLKETRQKMTTTAHSNNYSEEQIRKTFQSSSKDFEELIVLKTKLTNEIYKVLNEEQKIKLTELQNKTSLKSTGKFEEESLTFDG